MIVSPNPMYASELFGAGHAAISYPDEMMPKVTLTIPPNAAELEARDASDDDIACPAVPAVNYTGAAEITFTLLAGMFDSNVTGLMWDEDGAAETETPEAAPGTVASIVSGGRKGDNSIKIKIEAAAEGGRPADNSQTPTRAADTTTCGVTAGDGTSHTISFNVPKLAGLDGALSGANITDTNKDNDQRYVRLRAESRIISGEFTDGIISGGAPHFAQVVVSARDSVTLDITPETATKTIVLKGDSAFKAVKGANPETGYVQLATVTVMTKQEMTPGKPATPTKHMYNITGLTDATPTERIFSVGSMATESEPWTLHDLDGEPIDEGLRGTLTVNAMGDRDLFNEDDMLFIDYDKNGKMGSGEEIDIDGNMGMGDALSVDPDKSNSFDKNGTGKFNVYYKAGGKGDINHGAKITLTAMVDYSDPTAIDEKDVKSTTTLNFDGVTSEVDAYAIPQSGNGKGDMANVRVRCEAANGCRVFLECWDDMGMRNFGEAGMIASDALAKWDSMAIEGVIGVEDATSRHSCRILSAGTVKVQQLTRDGSSGTLVNNTYIGK